MSRSPADGWEADAAIGARAIDALRYIANICTITYYLPMNMNMTCALCYRREMVTYTYILPRVLHVDGRILQYGVLIFTVVGKTFRFVGKFIW